MRHKTVPVILAITFEAAKAFFPLIGKWIPHEAQRVEPLTAIWRHGILILALLADPLP